MRKLYLLAVTAALAAACSGGDSKHGGTPMVPEVEPNDLLTQATAIAPNSTVLGTVNTAADMDYFAFVVSTPSAVTAQTSDPTGAGCTNFTAPVALYTSGGSLIASGYPGVDPCSSVGWFLVPGTYFLRVAGTSAAAPPPQYVLDLAVTPAAGPFSSDALLPGSIDVPRDFDCAAVTNPTGAAVSVHLETNVGGVGACLDSVSYNDDTYLYVFDGSGLVVGSDDDMGINNCSLLYTSVPAGATRYACVTGWSNTIVPSYALQIDFP